ncbi:MAG: bifunctional hydroxymethylpyrimidine kinase/phosphomethylpyrimidine kinase [Chloroflexi bacterium]|nr:bifunctional hydroxymethylpyrimidine kinase/phosphomethylpyrimidine kinase [Chloroflexota bacterium]
MTILVVGSLAFDDLETPFGRASNVLGGATAYFCLAASLFAPVRLVSVVGEDFPERHLGLLASRGVDLEGLQRRPGKTFRWVGRYHHDMNVAETLQTELNVFADFHPALPPAYCASPFVFLANIDPDLQLEVLDQAAGARLVGMDSMNYWIDHKPERVWEVLRRVHVATLNDAEVRQLCGTPNIFKAARQLLELGPQAVVVKKGEHGAAAITREGILVLPAYPLETVLDPTGAGDSFAGALFGHLAQTGTFSLEALRQALAHACVVASFTVEDFGVERLARLTRAEIAERYELFRQTTAFYSVASAES